MNLYSGHVYICVCLCVCVCAHACVYMYVDVLCGGQRETPGIGLQVSPTIFKEKNSHWPGACHIALLLREQQDLPVSASLEL